MLIKSFSMSLLARTYHKMRILGLALSSSPFIRIYLFGWTSKLRGLYAPFYDSLTSEAVRLKRCITIEWIFLLLLDLVCFFFST